MIRKSSYFSSEISLKYFISQSVASIGFLFFTLISFSALPEASNFFLCVALIFKLGVPPFHSWLARILLVSPYKILFLIAVVQKLIPLHILSNFDIRAHIILFFNLFTFFTILFWLPAVSRVRACLLISAWGNTIWLVSSVAISQAWGGFLVTYGLLLATALRVIDKLNIQKLTSLARYETSLKLLCIINFLNLAGLPPLVGFFAKLSLLKLLLRAYSLFFIFMLLNSSLLVLYAYLVISFYALGAVAPRKSASLNVASLAALRRTLAAASGLPLFIGFSI